MKDYIILKEYLMEKRAFINSEQNFILEKLSFPKTIQDVARASMPKVEHSFFSKSNFARGKTHAFKIEPQKINEIARDLGKKPSLFANYIHKALKSGNITEDIIKNYIPKAKRLLPKI